MRRSFLLLLIFCITLSCIKKEQEQNSEGQIIDLMNQNKADEALNKIDNQLLTNKTDDVLYLKASSLSMKAGIDIYALFPLLKIKIFDVAISQWSQNREFQKKAQAQKNSIGVSNEDLEEKKNEDEKIIEKYKPIDKDIIKYVIESQYMQSNYKVEKPYCEIYLWGRRHDIIRYSVASTVVKLHSENECNSFQKTQQLFITSEIDDQMKTALADEDHRSWFERKKEQNRKSSYVKLMGTFWTLIDMVPLISKIPIIDDKGFSYLEEAQSILADIRSRHPDKTDELGEKARKQLMMISALKIVGHLKNAFDFETIKNPMDFICSSNDRAAEEILASQEDALYLINSIDDQEVIKKNKKLFDEIKGEFEKIVKAENENPELQEARLKELREALLKSKEENCD